jgi:hypothetical protein
VAKIRRENADRAKSWTGDELKALVKVKKPELPSETAPGRKNIQSN